MLLIMTTNEECTFEQTTSPELNTKAVPPKASASRLEPIKTLFLAQVKA